MEKSVLPTIRLTMYGCIRAVQNGVSEVKQKFDWASAIADAAIMALLGFFGTLGGCTFVGVPPLEAVVGAGIAAGSQFATILAIKRKLIKAEGC